MMSLVLNLTKSHHALSLTPQYHVITFFLFFPSSPFPTKITTTADHLVPSPRRPTLLPFFPLSNSKQPTPRHQHKTTHLINTSSLLIDNDNNNKIINNTSELNRVKKVGANLRGHQCNRDAMTRVQAQSLHVCTITTQIHLCACATIATQPQPTTTSSWLHPHHLHLNPPNMTQTTSYDQKTLSSMLTFTYSYFLLCRQCCWWGRIRLGGCGRSRTDIAKCRTSSRGMCKG